MTQNFYYFCCVNSKRERESALPVVRTEVVWPGNHIDHK